MRALLQRRQRSRPYGISLERDVDAFTWLQFAHQSSRVVRAFCYVLEIVLHFAFTRALHDVSMTYAEDGSRGAVTRANFGRLTPVRCARHRPRRAAEKSDEASPLALRLLKRRHRRTIVHVGAKQSLETIEVFDDNATVPLSYENRSDRGSSPFRSEIAKTLHFFSCEIAYLM